MTLLETLFVMAVIAILLGVSLTGVSSMSTPRRQTAVTSLKGVLDQARAHAVASRKYTALMVVDGIPQAGVEPLNLVKHAVFEVGEPDEDGIYTTISRQITEWKSLPDGVCFVKNLAGHPTVLDLPLNRAQFQVRGLAGSGYPDATLGFLPGSPSRLLAGVVFAPNGSVVSPRLTPAVPHLDLHLVEGTVDSSGTGTSVTPSHDPPRMEGVRLTRLTGVTRYVDFSPNANPPAAP